MPRDLIDATIPNIGINGEPELISLRD